MPAGDYPRLNLGSAIRPGICTIAEASKSVPISKIYESQLDLSETHAMIAEIRDKALTALIINRIPDHRILGLKRRWIMAFLNGRNPRLMLMPERFDIFEHDGEQHVSHRPPSGVPAVPSFTVMRDLDEGAEDPDLFIANRITVLVSLSQIAGFSVVEILRFIEGSASPLEQLARQAE